MDTPTTPSLYVSLSFPPACVVVHAELPVAVVVGGVVARVCCFACAPPVGNATRFSHGLFGTSTTKKKKRTSGRFKFLHSCLFDRGRACQNTRQPAGFSQKGNEWKTAPRTRDGEGQVLTRRGISTTEEVVTSTPELSSARNALAAQAPGWQLVNDGCQQHTTAVSVASS